MGMEGDNHAEGPMEAAANNPDSDISTVYQALAKNRPDVLKKLMEDGMSIHEGPFRDGFLGYTALHWAAIHGRAECLRVLLNAKPCEVDVDVRDELGRTPLMEAVRFTNKECIKIFLERKANTKISDERGETALHQALLDTMVRKAPCYKKQPDLEVVKWLV